MPGITEKPKGKTEEAVPQTALGRGVVTDPDYLMMLRPRLPRAIVASTRVNLNHYWDDLTKFYTSLEDSSANQLPLSSGFLLGTNSPVVEEQKGENAATQPLTTIELNRMVEQLHIYRPEK